MTIFVILCIIKKNIKKPLKYLSVDTTEHDIDTLNKNLARVWPRCGWDCGHRETHWWLLLSKQCVFVAIVTGTVAMVVLFVLSCDQGCYSNVYSTLSSLAAILLKQIAF